MLAVKVGDIGLSIIDANFAKDHRTAKSYIYGYWYTIPRNSSNKINIKPQFVSGWLWLRNYQLDSSRLWPSVSAVAFGSNLPLLEFYMHFAVYSKGACPSTVSSIAVKSNQTDTTYAAVLIAGYGRIAVIYYLSICHPAVNRQYQGSWSRHTHTLAAYGELHRPHHDPLGWSRLLATSVESLSACNIIPEWSLPSRSLWIGACGWVEHRAVQMRCRWCSTSCCQVKQAAMAKCGQSVFF